MSSRVLSLVLMIFLTLFSFQAFSAMPRTQILKTVEEPISSAPVFGLRSSSDTLLVMGPWGSGASHNGQFQNQCGDQAWNDWTHRDLTTPEGGNHWHTDTYNAEGLAGHGAGNLAAWCGSLEYPSCDVSDLEGGYGNNWNDQLGWIVEVADPSLPSVVDLDLWINLDIEPGYDFLTLKRKLPGDGNDFVPIADYDGQLVNQHLVWQITIPAGDYSGPDGNQVELRFAVTSDGAWSDEDCSFYSAGACQLDDITVHIDNGDLTTFDDFENGELGNWMLIQTLGSGDFTHLEANLGDVDNCRTNYSPQVCFVDDGVVVPGTGGTPCIDWCYGPNGFIFNWDGGLIRHSNVNNAVESPVMSWPENHNGGFLDFDAYAHEGMSADSPFIVYGWNVRSVTGTDSDAINAESWRGGNIYFAGGPEYRRHHINLTPYLESDATFVQVRMFVLDYPTWSWEWAPNGTPAPYFDNVRVLAVDTYGPSVALSDEDLATDSFPASGILDMENPATNSVRFDSGKYLVNDVVRDYIQAFISTQGDGVDLNTPVMHYRLIPSPLFDSVRSSGLPNSGIIPGTTSMVEDAFRFDLPDTGFFYPGDVIHYFFKASQQTPGGDETVMVPADTSGFSQNPWGANSELPGICAYDQQFSVRALPSVFNGVGDHPRILIWDNACDPEFTSSLRHDLNQSQAWAYDSGFDLFRKGTKNSGSLLARNASPEILAGYTAVFYFSGANAYGILGDSGQAAQDDLALLTQWLDENIERGLFINGDHVLAELNDSVEGQYILNEYLGAELVAADVSPMINGATTPMVLETALLPALLEEWLVTGYCPDSRVMSAILPQATAIRLAEFATPSGQGSAYPYAALMSNQLANGTLCYTMPYDFRRVQQLPGWRGVGVTLRSRLLRHIASHFAGVGIGIVDMSPVPDQMNLSASAYPNPFNPSTTISFNLPRKGHLNLKVYNIRGELVQTLLDESHEAGPGRVVWSGDDQSGGSVASGIYFYKLSFGSDVIVEKMMMVK